MIRGRVFKFGKDIDTDVIIPARYLNTTDPKELARHCMEDIDPEFPKKVKEGDIIVADTNFGCGSSREHAPVAIKACGISLIIAKSFARIFYRNAFNVGLPLLEGDNWIDEIKDGDVLEVEIDKGLIRNVTTGKEYSTKPIPPFMMDILKEGGLMGFARRKIHLEG